MDIKFRQYLKITLSFVIISLLFLQSYALSAKESKFNHDKTGFELIGPHERLSCDSCHIRGIFKGIPNRMDNAY